jgi:hypothetical protein
MELIKVAGKAIPAFESLRLADIFRASVVDSTTEICLRADGVEREVERLYRLDGAARTRRDLPHGCRRNLARPRELLTPRNSGIRGIPGSPPAGRLSGSIAQRWLSQIKHLLSNLPNREICCTDTNPVTQ